MGNFKNPKKPVGIPSQILEARISDLHFPMFTPNSRSTSVPFALRLRGGWQCKIPARRSHSGLIAVPNYGGPAKSEIS